MASHNYKRNAEDLIDEIVINELKWAITLNLEPKRIDCSSDTIEPDMDFIHALLRTLEYFSPRSDYLEFVATLNLPEDD